jgi:hypothetical protein
MNTRVLNVEHKSTSLEIGQGSSYWRRLLLDGQVSTYKTGVRAFGYEPVGTLYDVVRKVQLRPQLATPVEERKYTQPKDRACKECKKKNPTPAPHVEKVGEGDDARDVACIDGRIVTDPGGKLYANLRERDETPDEYRERVRADIAANPDKYFQRGLVVRLEQEERDAAKDAWELARQIRDSQLEGRWPRNPEACDSYGAMCAFWSVCTGETTIDDPTRFRDAEQHQELQNDDASDGKKRLPLLTISSMRAYRSCPRKYYFAYERRRRSISDADALRFGTIFHLGLEVWWSTVDIAQAIAAMRAAYAKHAIDLLDTIRAEELMLGYHVRWKDEPLHVLAVEAQFRAPLVNPATGAPSKTWELGGKIDAIVLAPDVPGVVSAGVPTLPAPAETSAA